MKKKERKEKKQNEKSGKKSYPIDYKKKTKLECYDNPDQKELHRHKK